MNGSQPPADLGRQRTQRPDSDFALQAAGLGVWEVDPTTNLVLWDDQCRKLFGLAKDNQLPYEQAIQSIHADDVDRVNQAVKRAMSPESGGLYDETYRTIGIDDGKLRWVRFWGQGYFTPAGTVSRFVGVAQEVPDRMLARQKVQETQQQLMASFDDAPVGIAIISQQALTFQLANPFYGRLVGRSKDQLVGKSLLAAMPELAG
ncbi:MAG TPA: PAS domain S-box protein, partial [Fibrella sp.]